jgi:glutamate-1-semialdehyde 2,1-aminomutase
MADDIRLNSDLAAAAAEAEARYRAANPKSAQRQDDAARSMPGGNTRTVLWYSPFPLVWTKGEGARLTDLDGHRYTDFLGEYTAGLYGHSHPVIQAALKEAIEGGIVLGGPNRYEADLAAALCARFPSIERVRFCNSGTEANLLAISLARTTTGRSHVMVFDGAYHGGLLMFGHGGSPLNVPFPYVIAPYNDSERTLALIEANARELAAVVIEPMMGSAGGIPAGREFLAALRQACTRHGITLIFDEVMTSRLSPSGLQGALGIIPDMTTLGKYLGGGASFGAFGGRADILDRLDPRRPDAIAHAGTFNNNVMSMAAGLAGLTKVFTPEAAVALNARGDRLRDDLNALAKKRGLPLLATGIGSILGLHFSRQPVRSPADLEPADAAAKDAETNLRRLFHFDLLAQGQFLARRGFVSLSLPLTDTDCAAFVAAADEFLAVRGPLLAAVPA